MILLDCKHKKRQKFGVFFSNWLPICEVILQNYINTSHFGIQHKKFTFWNFVQNSQIGSDYMYEYFEQLLKERGLRTADVCKATGISQSTISNWKKRRNCLSPTNLKKIADFFGVSVDCLMGSEDIEFDHEHPAEAFKITGFLDGENLAESMDYYLSKDVREMADLLHKNPEYQVLFDASKKVKLEDIEKVAQMINLMIQD